MVLYDIKKFKSRIFTLILFVLIFLIFISKIALVSTLLILSISSILEFLNISKITKKIFIFCFKFLFIVYIFTFCFYFLSLSSIVQFKLILFTLCLVALFSIGGFVLGKIIKGPKLTKISPKTISGAIGSIVFQSPRFHFHFSILQVFSPKILLSGLVTSILSIRGFIFLIFKKKSKK